MAFSLFGVIKGLLIQKEDDRTKQLALEIGSATANTKTTVTAAQTANRTITLPDATDTLVGRATTDTLTNKTLSGNTAATLINGSGTMSVNTSGTVTLPNATDTLVGKATTDTLTNKTIDADGTGNVISNIDDGNIKAAAAIDATKIANGSVSNAEFQYLDGVTSSIQTQLTSNGTAISDHIADATGAHTASAITNVPSGNLTAVNVQAALNELQTEVDGIAGGGANVTLSNLTGPTAINQSLLPGTTSTFTLGATAARWLSGFITTLRFADLLGVSSNAAVSEGTATLPQGTTAGVHFRSNLNGGPANIGLYSSDNPGVGDSGNVSINSGNAAVNNSGDITIYTGTAATTRGKIKLVDGSEGTPGRVWTSTGTAGEGRWAAPPAPTLQTFTSGIAQTYGLSYYFTVTSANATAGANYSNNGNFFTVTTTISGQTTLLCTSTGAPTSSGTLTKIAGTGDTTITFSAARAPAYLKISMVGGGGGGGVAAATGGGQASAAGGGGGGGFVNKLVTSPLASYLYTVGSGGASASSGGTTTFSGGSLSLSANGGSAGPSGSATGGPTFSSGAGGGGGTASGGDYHISGGQGSPGIVLGSGQFSQGAGGDSHLASSSQAGQNFGTATGTGGVLYGGGGFGGSAGASQAAQNGGVGAAGIIIVEEYY